MDRSTPKPRTCQVRLLITDARGTCTVYDLVPSTPPDLVQGFRLHKRGTATAYRCTLSPAGAVACTCPGHTFHPDRAPCKHLRALQAIGLLDPQEYQRLRDLELQNQQTADRLEQDRQQVEQLRRAVLAGAAKPPRRRRAKQAA
jgi:hypothetical protein